MSGSNTQYVPPWEHRQLVAVPYLANEAHDDRAHQRQGSTSGLAEMKMPQEHKQRSKPFWKKSADTPMADYVPSTAPYETALDLPARQGSFEPSSASTSTTSSPLPFQSLNALPGTMSTREKPRRKDRRREAASVDEISKGESFTKALKSLFTSKSTSRPVVECERIRTGGHWTEDDY